MKVFIIGITGGVGGLLAAELQSRGDHVSGLVRLGHHHASLTAQGMTPALGSLAELSEADLAEMIREADAIVFAAGSNGGSPEVTKAIDGEGVEKAIRAAHLAGVSRFLLVSVLPESWRERDLGADVEYYFSVKKGADVHLSHSGLDWVILRPSLLVDGPRSGTVALGPAGLHGQISRADVASTLAELLHEPRISRQILELDGGSTPITDAVHHNVQQTSP